MNYIATISENYDFDLVLKDLVNSGFTIERVREITRTVSVRSKNSNIDELRKVPGILNPEVRRRFFVASNEKD